MKYRGQGNAADVTERVSFGKWTIRNRFCTTRDINKWGMVYFGSKPNDSIIQTLKDFENRLPPVRIFRLEKTIDFHFFIVITTLWYYN